MSSRWSLWVLIVQGCFINTSGEAHPGAARGEDLRRRRISDRELLEKLNSQYVEMVQNGEATGNCKHGKWEGGKCPRKAARKKKEAAIAMDGAKEGGATTSAKEGGATTSAKEGGATTFAKEGGVTTSAKVGGATTSAKGHGANGRWRMKRVFNRVVARWYCAQMQNTDGLWCRRTALLDQIRKLPPPPPGFSSDEQKVLSEKMAALMTPIRGGLDPAESLAEEIIAAKKAYCAASARPQEKVGEDTVPHSMVPSGCLTVNSM